MNYLTSEHDKSMKMPFSSLKDLRGSKTYTAARVISSVNFIGCNYPIKALKINFIVLSKIYVVCFSASSSLPS